jgi:hypothetical protein
MLEGNLEVWVSLRLDGDVGWFILVVLLGLCSSLEHGGCQILGAK